MYRIMEEKGHIDDEDYDRLGFPADTTIAGEEVRKTNPITNEKCQRALLFNHKWRVEQRAQLRLSIQENEQQAKDNIHDEEKTLLQANKECENLVLSWGAKDGKQNLLECELLHFSKAKKAELSAFVRCRLFETLVIPNNAAEKVEEKKGKLQEAMVNVPSLILQAFNHRGKEVVFKETTPAVDNTGATETNETEARRNATFQQRTASTYLFDASFQEAIEAVFNGDETMDGLGLPPHMEQAEHGRRALMLARKMRIRLEALTTCRLESTKQGLHWAWRWAEDNINAMAAIIVYFGHAKVDMASAGVDTTLLHPAKFNNVDKDNEELEGVYLYMDADDNNKIIRSGKVFGRSFKKRHAEHHKAAQLKRPEDRKKKFYQTYPLKTVHNPVADSIRRGYFDNLRQVVALAVDRRRPSWRLALQDGKIFVWPREVVEQLKKKKRNIEIEMMDALTLLIENAYDVCIAPRDNVSTSPGFESLGMLGAATN